MTQTNQTHESDLVDGENNSILVDEVLTVKHSIPETARAFIEQSDAEVGWLPMSGLSAGTGIFQVTAEAGRTVVGLKIDSPPVLSVKTGNCEDLRDLSISDVVVDSESAEICCGCALTLEQINQALAEAVGSDYQVMGADLTSFQYASAGASFMTGGMGPQRRYCSDSVLEIALFDGTQHRLISGEELFALAGTYGWTGIVTALRCRYFQLPSNEIAVALPVSNEPASLARLLARFAPNCFLADEQGVMGSKANRDVAILGIEHVTIGSMQPMFQSGADESVIRRARQVEQNCIDAGVEGIVFVSGYCNQSVDLFLEDMIDGAESETMTIAGVDIEYAEVFSSAEEMRVLREAIPYAARMQKATGAFGYKSHTDATLRLPENSVEAAMAALWQNNMNYIHAVEAVFNAQPGLQGDIIIYGHLNPFGVDPHNRVTFSCDDPDLFNNAKAELDQLKRDYYRSLKALVDDHDIRFIGGEKMSDSERFILPSYFERDMQPPGDLLRKYEAQKQAIAATPACFNWRTLPPYNT